MSCPPVLHALAWPGELSGAVRSMEESLAALRGSGVDARAWLTTASSFGDQPAFERFRRRGIPFESRAADLWLAPRAVTALRRALRDLGPGGILHTHGERALLWGRAAARLARVRHVHTQHGFVAHSDRDRRRVRVAKRLTSGLSALIAVDDATQGGVSEARVIPNVLDAASFRAEAGDREALRRRLGIAPGAPCLLYLGRLSPEKGADLLALIQARLQASSGAGRLIVAGSGPLASGVEAMSDVRLLGPRSDAASLLAAADVLLMPSNSEGLPMVALEAAAIGTPVVAFPAGGLRGSDLAQCVPMGDVDALVGSALGVVREPSRRAAALEASRMALEAHHHPDSQATSLSALYRSL